MHTDDRHQICCSICGLVTTEATRRHAIAEAAHHHRAHPDDGATIEVYDAMARRGVPRLWTVDPDGRASATECRAA